MPRLIPSHHFPSVHAAISPPSCHFFLFQELSSKNNESGNAQSYVIQSYQPISPFPILYVNPLYFATAPDYFTSLATRLLSRALQWQIKKQSEQHRFPYHFIPPHPCPSHPTCRILQKLSTSKYRMCSPKYMNTNFVIQISRSNE